MNSRKEAIQAAISANKERVINMIGNQNISTLSELEEAINLVLGHKLPKSEDDKEDDDKDKEELLNMVLTYESDEGNLEGFFMGVDFDSNEIKAKKYKDEEEALSNSRPQHSVDIELTAMIEIIKMSVNSDRIFNSVYPVVKEEYLRRRVPVIYNQLQRVKIIKKDKRTLGAAYHPALKSYVMYYNPNFIVEFAIREYLASKNSFKNGGFKESFIYNLMFLISHEMMHILRNHTQERVSLLKDSDHQMVNILGDSFINITLSDILKDPKLVTDTVKPTVGLTNETYFEGVFHDKLLGDSTGSLIMKFDRILSKYTGNKFRIKGAEEFADSYIPTEDTRLFLKFHYPQKSIAEIFQDNSTNFIKCFEELFNAIGEIKQLNKDRFIPDLEVGTPVRVKSTGNRGVIVDIVEEDDEEKYKVAASTSAEGDDGDTVDSYNNDEKVNILGDYSKDELKPIAKVYDSPEGEGEGEGIPVDPDDVEIEDHTTEKSKDKDKDKGRGTEGTPPPKERDGIAIGDTVKVNGRIGVVGNIQADGKLEVEGIEVLELFLNDNFKKTGELIGVFSPEEVEKYNFPKKGSDKGREGEDSEDEEGPEGDGSGEGGDDEGGEEGEGSGEGDEGDEEGDEGDEEGPDSGGGEGESDEEGLDSDDGDDSSSGGSGEDDEEDLSQRKSKMDSLYDEIARSQNNTALEKEKDDEEREKEAEEGSSRKERKEAADKLKDDIKKAIGDAKKRDGLSEEEREMLKDVGLDKVVDIPEISKGDWSRALARILSNALNMKSTYDPNRPSRRVPDAFGSPRREKDIKDIILALDCSGSMGAPQFRESIQHTQTFLNTLGRMSPDFHLILWGGDADELEYIRISHKEDVFRTMMSKGNSRSWSTDPKYMFQYIIDNIWNEPDAIIIYTDGGFWSSPTREIEAFIRRNQERMVWVLTSNGTIRNAKKFDPTVEMEPRYIKQGQ